MSGGRGRIFIAALALRDIGRITLKQKGRRCLRTVDAGNSTRSGRRHGAWHVERHLNSAVAFAANGQLTEVAAVVEIGPLPAAWTDLDHVQRLMNLGPAQPETDDWQIPFIAKLLAAAQSKCAAHLLNLPVLRSRKRWY